jgi:phosphohistidine phosphatase
MKEIIVVRHAKSDWGNEGLRDIDRCLNERGYSDAYSLATWFKKQKKQPELILCSTATRALSTALIFSRAIEFPVSKFVLEPDIYEAETETLLKILWQQNDNVRSLMLFGHNPGLTNLCNELGEDFYLDNLPTCGMVFLQFECNKWKELKSKSGKVKNHVFPKEFKN